MLIMLSEEDGQMLSLCSDCEACGHWADVSSLVTGRSNLLLTVFSSQIPGRKKTGGARGGVALWKESYPRAQRQDWTLNERSQPPLSAASVWDSPKHDTPSAWVSSACRGDLHVLKWRCGICNNAALKFAVFLVRLLDRGWGSTESASWPLQEVQSGCWGISTADLGVSKESARKGLRR